MQAEKNNAFDDLQRGDGMHTLTQMIREDMVPALGVTEPGAIAFAAAKAKTLVCGELRHLKVSMNSGLYKNAYSCGLPGTDEVEAVYAAALGYVAGDVEKELEALSGIRPEDLEAARRYVKQGKVTAELVKYCTIVVSTVPIMLVYPFLTKYFEKGVMIGAIKG